MSSNRSAPAPSTDTGPSGPASPASSIMGPEGFQAALAAQGVPVDAATLVRLETYAALLAKWQGAINLVGPETLVDVWRRHMLDSAQLAPWIPPGARVLDLGSGAGFPGMVLAILLGGQGVEVHLAESDQRKCTFLSTVNRACAAGAIIHAERIENLASIGADVVTARALAPLDRLVSLAVPHRISTGKCLFLKGKQWETELTEAGKVWKMQTETHPSLTDDRAAILDIGTISPIKTKG